MSAKNRFVTEILTKLWDQKRRIQKGLEERAKSRKNILDGGDVSKDERYLYILESSKKVTQFLRQIASNYDKHYPEDAFLNLDIYDILQLVMIDFDIFKDGTNDKTKDKDKDKSQSNKE